MITVFEICGLSCMYSWLTCAVVVVVVVVVVVFHPAQVFPSTPFLEFPFWQSKIINLLTPKSDKHLISPYNIIPELNIKVMRIKEMITN